jgi:hypothetical protein
MLPMPQMVGVVRVIKVEKTVGGMCSPLQSVVDVLLNGAR